MSGRVESGLGEDLQLVRSGDAGRAEAWLWWSRVPELAGEKLGLIGRFSADSAAAAAEILGAAEAALRQHGCTRAVGPMDGSTWRAYRWVTEPGREPPFQLEPNQPATWPKWWQETGYTALAEYYSTATDDLTIRDQRLDAVARRMKAARVTIRPLNPTAFEAELGRIYDVSVVSFQDAFLYTPLPLPDFVAQYRAVQERVRPEIVLLAEQGDRPVGYFFALPDYAQAQRGEKVNSIIVKTLAVRPGRTWAGLGALLLGEVHAAAYSLGYTRAIHALMHETNTSRALSAHYARTILRYTLFSKPLWSAAGGML